MSACAKIKTALDDEDYVEVSSLRIDNATISMAPLGGASTYQLNVEILPANATNRKLKYYIPSEYLNYVTVNSSGLITAHEKTEGKVVPLTVTSTTNSKAKLTINIVVEEIAVKSIRFAQEKVALLFEGESALANVEYSPAHATDGRSVEYESLNENVAKVEKTSSGEALITPVGAGQTRIKAVSTTTDQVVSEAFLPVTVDYLQAQYTLRTTGSPQWTQVINDYSVINFTLDVLGEHIDPNPEIEWYIGNERVLGKSDSRQYDHKPNSKTQTKYKIGVCIRAYKQEEEWLYSPEITIYNDFVGFELEYQNLSGAYTPYQYGDEVTFELLETSSGNTASYDWYLQKMNGDGTEYLVANTPIEDRNLTKRLNVVGDYQLWAKAKSGDGTYLKQTLFTFNAERLAVGDVLVVTPKMIEGGLPPDSYHWYIVECDEDGNYDASQKKVIGDTAQNEVLYYPITEAGQFRLIATSTTNGKGTTVYNAETGKREEYGYVGIPLRIYENSDVLAEKENDLVDFSDAETHAFVVSNASRVNDIVVEGCYYLTENVLYVHWTPTAGVPRYEAELIFEDGTVVILDSAENNAAFGSNFLYIPSEIAGFEDKFSIRIKQKDGLFSEYYYYNIPNAGATWDSTHIMPLTEDKYEYFLNVTTNVNTYVTTMDEMNALVQYILLEQPTKNSLIKKGNMTVQEGDVDVLYDTFTVTFYTTLVYTNEMISAFSVDTEDVPNEYIDIYTMICGAQQQGPFLSDFKLSVEKNEKGAYVATFSLPNGNKNAAILASPSTERNDDVASAVWSEDPYKAIDITYPVDQKEGVYVGTSDELIYVLEQGYRPVPSGSDDLSALYKQIKSVYSSLVDESMSDVQKALAFYDWLCLAVTYDKETETLSKTQSQLENYRYESHRLEGIFAVKNVNNRHALSDGYAKAFAALCGLAGIPCRSIAGRVGTRHVYNKVYLMDAWYVVDVTFGIATEEDLLYVDHTCFLMSDTAFSSYCAQQRGSRLDTYGLHPSAEKTYDYFMETVVRGQSIYINSQEALEGLLSVIDRQGAVAVTMECSSSFFRTISEFRAKVNEVALTGGKYVDAVVDISDGNKLRVYVLLKDNE